MIIFSREKTSQIAIGNTFRRNHFCFLHCCSRFYSFLQLREYAFQNKRLRCAQPHNHTLFLRRVCFSTSFCSVNKSFQNFRYNHTNQKTKTPFVPIGCKRFICLGKLFLHSLQLHTINGCTPRVHRVLRSTSGKPTNHTLLLRGADIPNRTNNRLDNLQ